MKWWEYKVITVDYGLNVESLLDLYGAQGWELTAIDGSGMESTNTAYAYLRRQLDTSPYREIESLASEAVSAGEGVG